jgi:hypothetical protein
VTEFIATESGIRKIQIGLARSERGLLLDDGVSVHYLHTRPWEAPDNGT